MDCRGERQKVRDTERKLKRQGYMDKYLRDSSSGVPEHVTDDLDAQTVKNKKLVETVQKHEEIELKT